MTRVLDREEAELLASDPGPVVRVGRRSACVALGNAVRVVSVGSNRVEQVIGETSVGERRERKGDGRRRRGVSS